MAMKPSTIKLLGLFVAAVVPAGALVLAARGDVATAPFGLHRVAVTHCVATLLLSWTLAGFVLPDGRSAQWWAFWIAIAAGITAWTASLGWSVGHELDTALATSSSATLFVARLLVRVLWCLALQFPWCVMARSLAEPEPQEAEPSVLANCFTLGLIVAFLVPSAYLTVLIEKQTALARRLWNDDPGRAKTVVTRLCDLGSFDNLGYDLQEDGSETPVMPRTARVRLESYIQLHERNVESLRSAGPTNANLVELAQSLLVLRRFDEAEAAVEPIASSDAEAAMGLAAVFRAKEDWAKSIRWYETAITLADRLTAEEDAERRGLIQQVAFDNLAFSARELKQFDRAEQHYREALTRLPGHQQQVHFHRQLARHYSESGRIPKMIAQLETVNELTPGWPIKPPGILTSVLTSGSEVGIFAPAATQEE